MPHLSHSINSIRNPFQVKLYHLLGQPVKLIQANLSQTVGPISQTIATLNPINANNFHFNPFQAKILHISHQS